MKPSYSKMKVMTFLAAFLVCGTVMVHAQSPDEDVTGYETVTVTIPATSYNPNAGGTGLGVPQMAKVKFNRQFPLVITSDDGRKPEYVSNWTLMNGYPNVRDWQDYPYLSGDDMLRVAYDKTYMGTRSSDVNDYQPLTFDDGTGHRRRFTLTSAVPPTGSSKTPSTASYDQINREDAKAMLRTGFSFAQHDVDDASSVESIKSDYTRLNTLWADNVGIGLKVMVEPNGNKNYVEAAKQSDEICWNIYQAATEAYPALDNTLAQWTSGTQPSTYTTTKATTRTFPNSDASGETAFANAVRTAVTNGSTAPMFYGCHGLGSYARDLLIDLATDAAYKDKVWVTGADEYWEYYNIYNNSSIENINWNGSALTFDVKVPTYKKNQFRELTLNVPGLTGAGMPTFSTASGKVVPTTGDYSDNGSDGFTMNIGLETRITSYIDQLMAVYRDDQTNEFVKRDLQYLIDQLWDGTTKTNYQNQLEAAPATHSYTVKASLGGTTGPVLATVQTDTDGNKQYAVPRYIVSDGKLYETDRQATQPYYKPTIATGSTASGDVMVSYTEKDLTSYVGNSGNITPVAVSVVEGEDMAGAKVIGAKFNGEGPVKFGSYGLAGSVVSGTVLTASTSLTRGSYKMIIGYGETWKDQGTYNYQILVDGTQVATFATTNATNNAVTEFTTTQFDITADFLPVTITTDNTNQNARWIDYVVFVQTGSLDPVAPTAVLTASVSGNMMVNKTATLTATTALNGGTHVSTAIYAADANGTKTSEKTPLATSNTETTVTYDFIPTATGKYYFIAESTNSVGTNSSQLITITAVANIDSYTLNIIDKGGSIALTTTVSSNDLTVDPLPRSMRSPFAKNYHYYNTLAEAKANSGNAITSIEDWAQDVIYVGYDVDSEKMGAGKKHAIWSSNGKYMHVNMQLSNSHSYDNMFNMVSQQYDCNGGNNEVNTGNLPFIDGNYLWEIGADPYDITLKNAATGRYAYNNNTSNPTYLAKPTSTSDIASYGHYMLLCHSDATNTSYVLRSRSQIGHFLYYHNNGEWHLTDNEANSNIHVAELPEVNVNVVNAAGAVEYTLHGRYMAGATAPSTVPFFLRRHLTSGQTFYYDAACENAVSTSEAVDETSLTRTDGVYQVYMKYTLESEWADLVSTAEDKQWYGLLFGNNQYLYVADNLEVKGQNPLSDENSGKWALMGTPYALKLVNYKHQDKFAGVTATATNTEYPKVYGESSSYLTTWELDAITTNNNIAEVNRSWPFIRLQGSYSGEAPYLFMRPNGNSQALSNTDNTNNRFQTVKFAADMTVTYHVRENASGQEVDFPVTVKEGATASSTLPTSLVRRGTANVSLHKTGYDGEAIDGTEKYGDDFKDIYVTYDIDYDALGVANMFSPDKQHPKWFKIKSGDFYLYNVTRPNDNDGCNTWIYNTANIANADLWAFVGTPYRFEIINFVGGTSKHAALASTAGTTSDANFVYVTDNTETYPYYYWETVNSGNSELALRLSGSDHGLNFNSSAFHQHGGIYSNNNNKKPAQITLESVSEIVTWYVVENGVVVDQMIVSHITDGTTLTMENMPEILKRRFCTYNNMYSDQACSNAIADNTLTVDADNRNIYVTYTLTAGAPTFYASVEAYNNAAAVERAPVLIRLYQEKYVNDDNGTADIKATKADANTNGKWALIGSPYSVQFYNTQRHEYLYVNMNTIQPGNPILLGAGSNTGDNTTWTLLDDASGQRSAICLKEDNDHRLIYMGYNGSNQVVMELLNQTTQAKGAEFIGNHGVDGLQVVLTYGANTLRTDNSGTSMAGRTETFNIEGYFGMGTPLTDVLPTTLRRAFCQYAFTYGDNTETAITGPMCTASEENQQTVVLHATYTVSSPFEWSTQDDTDSKYNWYYMVNNHRPSGEQGKMVFRDASPKLRVSQALVSNRLYLSNFEWCVIGDPYGFKLLNRYDPDRTFAQYIRVTENNDERNEGLQLEQSSTNTQNVFEMMPGQYSYNFWIHPAYTEAQRSTELTSDACSFVGNNGNGSAAIIPAASRSIDYLRTNSSANFRLEILSDATLVEYLKYAGFVGGLKYDVAASTAFAVGEETVDVAAIKTALLAGTATAEQKAMLNSIISNPKNIVQMEQGYYRIVPYVLEDGESHYYVQGYKENGQRTSNAGGPAAMPVETQAEAEKDAASIFWFEGTKEAETNYPRYYVKAQGLAMTNNGLTTEADGYQVRYEDLGAAITQLKVGDEASKAYLSCSSTSGTGTNQCFDEQAGIYKTRFYLQKVDNSNPAEMPLKKQMVKGHNGNNGSQLRDGEKNPWGKLPYTYWALYVPYDLEIVGGLDNAGETVKPGDAGFDVMPFIGISEHHYDRYTSGSDTYYNKGEYALFCESIDMHQKNPAWKDNKLFIPAGTAVMFRSLSGMQGITFTIPTNAPSTATEGMALTENRLQGTYLKVSNKNPKIRVFGKEWNNGFYTGRVGLFPRSSVETPLSSNNIYYEEPPRSQQSSAPGVFFSFSADDEATGLNRTPQQTMPDDDSLYDLQGRKVVGTARPGVYIRNGRKVVIK